MAYVYSASQTNSKYGNVKMSISLLRGDCVRTEKSVSFDFGVRFIVTGWDSPAYGMWNSIAAWYNNEQRFANANNTDGKNKSIAFATIPYYAYYTANNPPRNCTTECLCYSYSNDSISADTTSVDITIGVGWANYAGTQKGTLTFSVPIPEYIENGTAPTLIIKDLGNNKVQFSGVLGKAGTNNAMSSATLYYTTDGSDPEESTTKKTVQLSATSGSTYADIINITKACTVKGYTVCKFTHNTTTASGNIAAKYYVKPGNPGKPYLVDSSFKNGRLTVKQDWGWQWELAKGANTDSPVKGYRVRFYVDGINNSIVSYYTGDHLSVKDNDTDVGGWVYDRASTNYPMPMRAVDQSVTPGNKIELSIQAYTVNGAGTKLFSSEITSDEYTVQNAGIVNVKVDGEWKEGQVWVKAEGAWHEAETVNVKAGGSWRESQ